MSKHTESSHSIGRAIITFSRGWQTLVAVLYPLAVFLRHGRLNLELITGEGTPGNEDEPRKNQEL